MSAHTTSKFSTRSWREMVEKADDKNRHYESTYPVAYVFSSNRVFRDKPGYDT